MKKTIFLYLLVSFLLIVGKVEAQTFGGAANTSSSASDNKTSGEKASALQGQKSSATVSKAANDTKTEEEEEDPIFKNSVVNIGGKDKKEKKYDNSGGRVIRFKIVDGEVQFEEDKDRMILVYYDNYKVMKGMDNIVRCSMRMYILNDLETKINSIGLKLLWPEISTSIQMQQLNPGVSTYTDIMLLGNGCFTMDKTPTIEVNRCRIKGMSEEQCAGKVKWFARNRH